MVMADKPSKMARFVQTQNTVPDRQRSVRSAGVLDDLKVDVTQKRKRHEGAQTSEIANLPHPGHVHSQDTQKQHSFFSTEYEESITSGGTPGESTRKQSRFQSRPNSVIDVGLQNKPDANDGSPNPATTLQDQWLQYRDNRSSIIDRYVKGDSYPGTTSGRLSELSNHDLDSIHFSDKSRKEPIKVPINAQHSMMVERTQSSTDLGQESRQFQFQPLEKSAVIARPSTSDSDIEKSISAGFTYQPQFARPQPPAAKLPNRLQQRDVSPETLADRVVRVNRLSVPPPMQIQRIGRQPSRDAAKLAPSLHGQDTANAVRTTSVPYEQVNLDTLSNVPRQDEDMSKSQDDVSTSESCLDYELDNLIKLDYATLKNQSFDEDPRSVPFSMPGITSADRLDERLAAVSKQPPKVQDEYFASIMMTEWEEAGDWFLDRFAGLIQELKTIRKRKRDAARHFEKEVEQRNNDVMKKFGLTEHALNDMRMYGQNVLTPKKAKV